MAYKAERTGRYRSRIEGLVAVELSNMGLEFEYETDKFPYMIPKKYTPDFKVGELYIEVKGFWAPDERTKLKYVLLQNPDIKLVVALQTPHRKITKKSPTSYAQWCEKHSIPWCPCPPPKEFIESWLTGNRLTYRVQDASQQTRRQLGLTELTTVSVASDQ